MKKHKKKTIKQATAYDLHALLDYIIVEAAVRNESLGKRIRIPYKNVIKPDPQYANCELVVEITAHWNGSMAEEKDATHANSIKLTGPNKGRH